MSTKEQKLIAAGTAAIITEPVFALAHQGFVGAIAGVAIATAVYMGIDDIERVSGKEIPPLPVNPSTSQSKPSKGSSIAYRLLNGKSVREDVSKGSELSSAPSSPAPSQASVAETESRQPLSPAQMRKKIIPPGGYKTVERTFAQEALSLDPRFPVPQDMATIIERGFKPSRHGILLMETTEGHATEAINKLGHMGLAGSTGGGKTNVTRLVTAQLLFCGAKVYVINPNHAPVKLNNNRLEDWRPIEARLQAPIARTVLEIAALLKYFMKIFEERRNREQLSPKRGADIFLVIGEWPVVVEECPDAVKTINRLLRQARQYGIHVLAEYQDAHVKTIGGNSGTRSNYGTTFFLGGDFTTAKAMLGLPDGAKFDTTGLGKDGAVYLKSHSHNVVPGRVPFFSNKALYMLLGFPEDPVTDEIVSEEDFYEEDEKDIEDIFAKMPDVRNDDGDIIDDEDYPFSPSQDMSRQTETAIPALTPIIPNKGPRAEDFDDDMLIAVWNGGGNSVRKLMKILKFTNHEAQKAYKRIHAHAGAKLEAEAID